MIHDILLTCLSISKERLTIEDFLLTETSEVFIHPSERHMFQEIVSILNSMRDIVLFVKVYGGRRLHSKQEHNDEACESLRYGLYLNSFANGIEQVLIMYYDEIIMLEEYILQNPKNSIVYIYDKLQEQVPMATFLRKLVRGIKLRKLHGCPLLHYLFQHSEHGDNRLERIIKIVMQPVTVVFIAQLTNWLLYGRIDDDYAEFFIQVAGDQPETSTMSSEKGTSVAESCSIDENIWQYEIIHELLPQFLSTIWAEKVLFIGQTVLLFKLDAQRKVTNIDWTSSSNPKMKQTRDFELWQNREPEFFQQLQDINADGCINVHSYESTVQRIKKYVTTRLSQIAVGDIDLDGQLALIKDFYLLGRGELYSEFLRQICVTQKSNEIDSIHVNYIKAFQSAAIMVGVADELENFNVQVIKNEQDADATSVELNDFIYMPKVELTYKYVWPLNLLFSPKAIERYNIIFDFLLKLKKIQYGLHQLCREHLYLTKRNAAPHLKVTQLRNQLLFFIDNMQYYIQVDVVESQYNVFMNVINSNADFEEIQRAHSVFLVNVLSQCFLLSHETPSKTSITQSSCHMPSPIYTTICDIFHICVDFVNVCEANSKTEMLITNVENIEERFGFMITHLIKLLIDIKSCTNTPLLQLLLRLDYNHWFSTTKGIEVPAKIFGT